jgi:hypothetical protein
VDDGPGPQQSHAAGDAVDPAKVRALSESHVVQVLDLPASAVRQLSLRARHTATARTTGGHRTTSTDGSLDLSLGLRARGAAATQARTRG